MIRYLHFWSQLLVLSSSILLGMPLAPEWIWISPTSELVTHFAGKFGFFNLLFSGVLGAFGFVWLRGSSFGLSGNARSAGLGWVDAWKKYEVEMVSDQQPGHIYVKSKDASCWPRDAAKSELLFVAFGGKSGLYSKSAIQCNSSAGVNVPNSNTITYLWM